MMYKRKFFKNDGDNVETKQAMTTDDLQLQNLIDANANKTASDNIIWLYDDINDASLYKVKSSLNSINHSYDKLKLQY
jgi:hypothetical protein